MEILHGQFGGYVICINASDGIKKWDLKVDTNSWIQTAPTIVDLDGDGKLDFVVASWEFNKENNQSKVYAYRGYDQVLMWTFDLADVVYHGTTLLDVNEDGKLDLIIGDYDGNLYAINAGDGAQIWKFRAISYVGSPVVAGDLDGDGKCEMVFSSYYRYYALKFDGTVMWEYDIPDFKQSFRGAALSDIDDDGLPDVIFGTTGGQVIALSGIDGSEIWTLDLAAHIGKEFSIDHAPVVADFDADGILDVFIIGGFVEYPNWQSNYGRAYAISAGTGQGPDWTMFQNNIHRTGSICNQPTSITESVQISAIISPNPASEYITISKPSEGFEPSEGSAVQIFNTLGECVLELADVQHLGDVGHLQRIDISHLHRGVYYLRLGNRTQMFVKM
ncbi:MAG: VCBS repeat-containing protein [Candidatus Kapabacteria bacterium]|nr:VCBS repeat-containing protein [Candidatus Kapabacteria bacterium]